MTEEQFFSESGTTVPHLSEDERRAWAKHAAKHHPGFRNSNAIREATAKGSPQNTLYRFAPEVDYWMLWIWRILVLLVLLALCAANVRAQTDRVDPCQRGTKHFTVISTTANAQLVAGVANQNIYICGIWIAPVATATNITFEEGIGSVCGSNGQALPTMGGGGTGTAATGPNLAVNEGFVVGNGGWSIGMTVTAGDSVCIFVSAANQISGTIIWVQRP